ncbi:MULTISPECIES: hypothetical protein [unclassified Thiocapsa]|uniref:hypothetical protein n=1 Tax=unclassified Thiocapsa TaxID=2641286 RepID=UPI0035B0E5AE
MPTAADWSKLVDTTTRVRDRLASMDVGKVVTRTVGGAVILTTSFLVVANPHAPAIPDPSAVVSARIAPVGTVQIAGPINVSTIR